MKITIKKDIKVPTDNPVQPIVTLLNMGQEFTEDSIDDLYKKLLLDLFSKYGAVHVLDGIMMDENRDDFFEIEDKEESDERNIPIYKIEMYITDPNCYDYSLEDIETILDNSMSSGSAMSHAVTFGDNKKTYIKVKDMDEWDDSKWNRIGTPMEEYRKLFRK